MDVFKKKLKALNNDAKRAEREMKEAEEEMNATLEKCDRAEEDAREKFKEIQDLEDEIDMYESRYVTAQESLNLASTKMEEQTQVKRNLTERVTRDDGRANRLQSESEELTDNNSKAETRLRELRDENDSTENELEEWEDKREKLQIEQRELESKMIEVGNELRSKQINNDQNDARASSSDVKIDETSAKLDEVSAEAKKFEDLIAGMESQQAELDDEVEKAKNDYQVKQSEIEDLKNMINDM